MAELTEDTSTILDVSGIPAPDFCEPEEDESLFSDPETFGLPATLSHLGIDWNLLDISEFETYEPLGILVELAEAGKINPWDIDIVQLTDSFLGRVTELKKMDLRISSRTLLYSAILLRMKSSELFGVEEEIDEFDSDFLDELELPEPEEFPIPKLPVRRVSTRPVTLNELILELKKAETTLFRKSEKKARQVVEESHLLGPQLTTGDVLGIAHDEAISSRLSLIWTILSKLFMTQPVVIFSSFLEMSEDRIMDYLSLLFLASHRKIWLFQNELFGELYIYPGEQSGFSTKNNPPIFHETKPELKGEFSGSQVMGASETDFKGQFSLEKKMDEEPEKTFL
jgi:segregation and condensation protein A